MAETLSPALPDDLEAEARAALTALNAKRLRLVTAEGCTGGLLAALLTDLPGCSHAFDRGFVAYSNNAKQTLLGVPESVLDTDGPASPRAARAMAEGALIRSNAHIALAVTGYCEAGEGPDEPAGLVYIACARRGHPTLRRRESVGDVGRAQIRLASLRAALQLLRQSVTADGDSAAA